MCRSVAYRCEQNSWDVQSSIDLFSCADDVDVVVLDFVADENNMKTIEPKCHRCLPFLSISYKCVHQFIATIRSKLITLQTESKEVNTKI